MTVLDLEPPARQIITLAGAVTDDMLPAPTPGRLLAMAEAWHTPQAWEGLTTVGGGTMPAVIAGQAGLNELVIHGWDLAHGTGQPDKVDEASAEASAEFLSHTSAEAGQRGPFGPIVGVPPDACVLDRAVGLSGRDPNWPGERS